MHPQTVGAHLWRLWFGFLLTVVKWIQFAPACDLSDSKINVRLFGSRDPTFQESVHVCEFVLCIYMHERVCVSTVSFPGVYPGVWSWSREACEGRPAGSSWRVSADVNCQAFCLVH